MLTKEQYAHMDIMLHDRAKYSNTYIAKIVGCGATTVKKRRRGEPNYDIEAVHKRANRQYDRLHGGPIVEAEWCELLKERHF